MNISIDPYILYRLSCYIQGAVRQGAVLTFKELVQRFEKGTRLDLGGYRQQSRYVWALKNICSNFGFCFVLVHGTRGKQLCLTSKNNSHFNHDYDRDAPLAQSLLKVLQTTKVVSVKVYDTLLKSTELAKKSLERLVNLLKKKSERFGLVFFRVGRDLHVRLKKDWHISQKITTKNRPKNTPQNYDITCRVG